MAFNSLNAFLAMEKNISEKDTALEKMLIIVLTHKKVVGYESAIGPLAHIPIIEISFLSE